MMNKVAGSGVSIVRKLDEVDHDKQNFSRRGACCRCGFYPGAGFCGGSLVCSD